MSKKYYIRSGRSIEEILVRRKYDQQENSKTYTKQGVVPVQRAQTLAPLQQGINSVGNRLVASSSAGISGALGNSNSHLLSKSMNASSSQYNLGQSGLSNSNTNSNSDFLRKSQSLAHSQTSHQLFEGGFGSQNQSRSTLIPNSFPYAKLEDSVRDKEKQQMLMVVVTEYTRLKVRVQELEDELHRRELALKWKQRQRRRKQNSEKLLEFVSSGKLPENLAALIMAGKMDQESAQEYASDVDLGDTVRKVDVRMLHLQNIFAVSKSKTERKDKAVVKIQAWIRRFICRCRYAKFRKALYEWTIHRTKAVVVLVDRLLQSKSNQVTHMQQLNHNQQCHWLKTVFTKWMIVTKQFSSLRKYVRDKAHELAMNKQQQLMRMIFKQFVEVTLGANSIRGVNKQRAKLVEQIKQEISAKLVRRGELGVVPKFEVDKILYRRVLLKFLDGKRLLIMKRLFMRIKLLRTMAIRFARSANTLWFRKRAGSCFYAWSDYTFKVRSYSNIKRWLAPRHYELTYSQKQVDLFSRRRALGYCFRPWKRYHQLRMAVNKRYNTKILNFKRKMFDIMKAEVQQCRRFRRMVIDTWKGYFSLITSKPFRAWREYVYAAKNKNNESEQIVNAYVRWKTRSWLMMIIRTWRHQSLFGRVVGMYPRKKLLKNLSDQKSHAAGLQKKIAGETVVLEELSSNLSKEINKTRELETRYTLLGLDVNRQRMMVHHAQQEIARLLATIEAIAVINPNQVEHLKRLDPTMQLREQPGPGLSITQQPEDSHKSGKGSILSEEDAILPDPTASASATSSAKITAATTAVAAATPLASDGININTNSNANNAGPILTRSGSMYQPTDNNPGALGLSRASSFDIPSLSINPSGNPTSIGNRSTMKKNDRLLAKQAKLIFENTLSKRVEEAIAMINRSRWLLNMLQNKQTKEQQELEKKRERYKLTRGMSETGAMGDVMAGSTLDLLNSPMDGAGSDDGDDAVNILGPLNADPDSWSFAYETTEYYYVDGKRTGKRVIVSTDEKAKLRQSMGEFRPQSTFDMESNAISLKLNEDMDDIDDEAMVYDGINTSRGGLSTHTGSVTPSHNAAALSALNVNISRQSSVGSASRAASSPSTPNSTFIRRQSSANRLTAQLTRSPSMNRKSIVHRASTPEGLLSISRNSSPIAGAAAVPLTTGRTSSPAAPAISRSSSKGGLMGRVPSFITRNSMKSPDALGSSTGDALNNPLMQSNRHSVRLSMSAPKAKSPTRFVDPYEYIEEYEGAGAHTLLGILDFVFAGEVGGFCEEDKKEWKAYFDPTPPPSPPTAGAAAVAALDALNAADVGDDAEGGDINETNRSATTLESSEAITERDSASGAEDLQGSQALTRKSLLAAGQSRKSGKSGKGLGLFGTGDSVASKASSTKSNYYDFDEDDEFELEKMAKKEHKKQLREARLKKEREIEESRSKPKSWYKVINSLRNRSLGPGVIFEAAKEQNEATVRHSPTKFTPLSAVSQDMTRILDWEQWKTENHVPNRKRLKNPSEYQKEIEAAVEEASSDEEMDDEDE